MKIIVLGNRGMLGHYIEKYLKEYCFNVVGINRQEFNAIYPDFNLLSESDIIINCIGIIKPLIKKVGITQTIIVNSLFPHKLSEFCEKAGKKLIHITTDCVFDGKRGKYNENDLHNATDIYGKSKSLGEPSNCSVIRTSIIGEEKYGKKSLVEWLKTQSGKECDGYENHLWNGITCLKLSQVISAIISNNMYWDGIRHIYSNDITKYDLLCEINKVYDLNVKINRIQEKENCDRTLRSVFRSHSIVSDSIQKQILEMSKYKI